MITITEFEDMLKPYIRRGTPFMAYWHPYGYSVRHTGPIERTKTVYIVTGQRHKRHKIYWSYAAAAAYKRKYICKYGERPELHEEVRQLKPLKVSKAHIAQFRRFMRKLERADLHACTVEFDGVNLVNHGNIDLSL